MRRKIAGFLILNICLVAFLLKSFWPLLCLLVDDGAEDAISRAEIPAPLSGVIDELPKLIPKIIHQTFITCDVALLLNGSCTTHDIPAGWTDARGSCKDLHKDYEYKLWTDANAREFVVKEYPWFKDTWDNYRYPIQRADAIRYFALEHFGGVYIDLDNGCQRRLDPLLQYPAWVRRSHPTGIGNDVIGAVPHHPFLRRVIDGLSRYNHYWFSPYITIMSSTGPLFFSLLWYHHNAELPSAAAARGADRIRILFGDEYMGNDWSFFSHHLGSSWHMWDAKAIFWMGSHWLELTVFGFLIAGLFFAVLWWLWNAAAVFGGRRGRRPVYSPLWLLDWRRKGAASLNPGASVGLLDMPPSYDALELHEA